MKKYRKLSLVLCLALLCPFLSLMSGKEADAKVSVSADAAIVMDVSSGKILYSKNVHKKEYPASITKIMTALVAIENSSLSEIVTYSESAVLNLEQGASNIGIQVGEKLTMEESLYAILLMSANEACNGVAEHIAGSVDNFVKMMNQYAKKLGCKGTHFANSNGLWMKNHYTTAYDMALISRAAYQNPTFAKITGTKRYNIRKTNKSPIRYLYNHHGMLFTYKYPQYLYDYCVGGKTGYTVKCKWTLVTYAKKDGMTLLCVVLRTAGPPPSEPNEYTDTTKLLNHCFENYKTYPITNKVTEEINEQYLFTKFSPFYKASTSSLYLEEDASVTLPKGVKLKDATKSVQYYDAPLTNEEGEKIIGKLTYTYNDEVVGETNIYFSEKKAPTLNDSIDMSQWFDDAVEKANEEPFPWKKVAIIVILVLCVGFIVAVVWYRMRQQRDQWERRNHYRKARRKMRKHDRGIYYRKKF